MQLTKKQQEEILKFAKQKPNQEVCGLIVNFNVVPCKNISSEPSKHFILDPNDYLSCSRSGTIQAIYHSHVNQNKTSSLIDQDSAAKHNLPIITCNLQFETFHVFIPNPVSYVGRVFELGELDCFTLLRDFYQHELKIGLTEIQGKYSYSRKSEAFSDFAKLGFYKVESAEKIGDVILTKNGDAFHILIYLGGNTVLHQPMDIPSLIQNYDTTLKQKTTIILRHVSFRK